jgi:prenyltransferase beta subunit
MPYVVDGEGSDVRFVYCAIAIANILDIWEVVDKEITTHFILSCLTYEGGFGLQPGENRGRKPNFHFCFIFFNNRMSFLI